MLIFLFKDYHKIPAFFLFNYFIITASCNLKILFNNILRPALLRAVFYIGGGYCGKIIAKG
ncbi:hypothetical protein PTH_1505 [Pelotomaculum thermopropionicum SI]|uniref:Uncharacterized protein n=1 Tax=Pelotomaculum thermopropionicum (strain DSM 13744 / JCM 10971 / SI) TaxID=370438 RepID=A5D250_PELTS|nr:hypothetical protein PTH_1505 [Pelotomaculum thermopropionicum SI]